MNATYVTGILPYISEVRICCGEAHTTSATAIMHYCKFYYSCICLFLEGNFEALLVSIVYSQTHGGGERTQGFVYEWKNALMSAGNTQAQQQEDWHVTIL